MQQLLIDQEDDELESRRESSKEHHQLLAAPQVIRRSSMRETSEREDAFYSQMSEEHLLLNTSRNPEVPGNDRRGVDSDECKPKSRLSMLIPPPNPLLPKMIMPDEPLKNGFFRKFIDIGKKSKVIETERAPCGPARVQATRNALKQQQALTTILENGHNQQIQHPSNTEPTPTSNNLGSFAQNATQSFAQTASIVEDQNNPGMETSLRHYFYLEYRKIQQPNEKNSIVYSRFGKQNYDSEDKFCPDTFSQLIRTCNIKRLLRGLPGDMNLPFSQIQSQLQNQVKEYQRQREDGPSGMQEIRTNFPQEAAPSRSYYIPRTLQDLTLVFESRFECGNLQLAHKQSDKEYNLILQNDINSKGHTQWFYFRVQNTRKGAKVKFNMLNFLKSKSLFNDGMKVLTYSEKKLESEQVGWYRSGEEIAYYQNNYRRESMTNYQRCYYTFTFTYKFEHDFDTVYFAYSQPYSYSDLMDDISEIEKRKLDYVARNTLCRTLAGNRCDYLTITTRTNFDNEDRQLQKKGVVISARVHPGESNSSWMMKGVIDFLIGDSKEAKQLRDNFVFKIIPMLNPDGVINGNYRCSLAGCDLNRRWKYPSPIIHPTIFNAKQLVKQFASERPLLLFCDLHGHSKRKNVFMYGNSDSKAPEATRIFPYLMSKISGPLFSYDYSRFKVQRNKEQTARITLWRELKNPNIFTLEASFCGPKSTGVPVQRILTVEEAQRNDLARSQSTTCQNGDLNYHYSAADLMEIGKKLCETILLYNSTQQIDASRQIEEIKQYHQKKNSAAPGGIEVMSSSSTHASLTGGASKSLDRNSYQLSSSLKSDSATTSSKKSVSLIKSRKPPVMPSELTKTYAESDNMSSDSDATSSTRGFTFNGLSIKDIVSELKQKIQVENHNKKMKKRNEGGAILEAPGEEDSCSSSDEDSDSGDSEDNLDPEQMLELMPKRIIKKGNSLGKQQKNKKKNLAAQLLPPKKVMKEDDQAKKDAQPQRRQSIRSLRDFKKPTQSFLQKFGLVGPTNKIKYGIIQKRDVITQTSEYEAESSEDEDRPVRNVELSAMERDIMLCTGYVPTKLRKLAKGTKYDGSNINQLVTLVKAESNRIKSINAVMHFNKDETGILRILNPALLSPQITSITQLDDPVMMSSSVISNQRIKIDLAKIQDKLLSTSQMNPNNSTNNNIQVLFSKQASGISHSNERLSMGSASLPGGGSQQNVVIGSAKRQLFTKTQHHLETLNMLKENNVAGGDQNDRMISSNSHDVNNTTNKKNFRVMDLANFRHEENLSNQSLKLIGCLTSTTNSETRTALTSKLGYLENINNIKKSLKNELESTPLYDPQQPQQNNPFAIENIKYSLGGLLADPKSGPQDLTSNGVRSANNQQRKAISTIGSGNSLKARLTLTQATALPPPQKANTNLSQASAHQTLSQPRATSTESSGQPPLKNLWSESFHTSTRVSGQGTLTSTSTQKYQLPNNKLQGQKALGSVISGGGETVLEKIEEKMQGNNNRSSSQGNYMTTKPQQNQYQSIRQGKQMNQPSSKNLTNMAQTLAKGTARGADLAGMNTNSQSLIQLQSQSQGGTSAGVAQIKKQLLQDRRLGQSLNQKIERTVSSANQYSQMMMVGGLMSGAPTKLI